MRPWPLAWVDFITQSGTKNLASDCDFYTNAALQTITDLCIDKKDTSKPHS
jgi:hypothetical protein